MDHLNRQFESGRRTAAVLLITDRISAGEYRGEDYFVEAGDQNA
jgi:hypothetical protein